MDWITVLILVSLLCGSAVTAYLTGRRDGRAQGKAESQAEEQKRRQAQKHDVLDHIGDIFIDPGKRGRYRWTAYIGQKYQCSGSATGFTSEKAAIDNAMAVLKSPGSWRINPLKDYRKKAPKKPSS